MLEAEKTRKWNGLGTDEFIKRVSDKMAQKQSDILYNNARKKGFFNLLFGEESREEFIKRIRHNSRRHYKQAFKRAINLCEICKWGVPEKKKYLNIHHIIPIYTYSKIYYEHRCLPTSDYELSNLIVLCPNCHAIVHEGFKQKTSSGKIKILWDFLDIHGTENEEKILKFVSVINGERLQRTDLFKR